MALEYCRCNQWQNISKGLYRFCHVYDAFESCHSTGFPYTLASHVPIFLAMFLSRKMAACVVIGSTLGFFRLEPIAVVMRWKRRTKTVGNTIESGSHGEGRSG